MNRSRSPDPRRSKRSGLLHRRVGSTGGGGSTEDNLAVPQSGNPHNVVVLTSTTTSSTGFHDSPVHQNHGRLSVANPVGPGHYASSDRSPSSVNTSRSTLALATATTPVNSAVGSPVVGARSVALPPAAATATASYSGTDQNDGGGTGNVSIGNSTFYDNDSTAPSGRMTESQRDQLAHLEIKMAKVHLRIKNEKQQMQSDIDEYLKCCESSKNNPQLASKVKELFEKKNQKSAHDIGKLQKKLEEYDRRKRELEYAGSVAGDGGAGGMGGAGQKVMAGVKSMGGKITKMSKKPKELAHQMMPGRHGSHASSHFGGSADNLSSLSSESSLNNAARERGGGASHPGSASLPRDSLRSVGSGGAAGGPSQRVLRTASSGRNSRKCLSEDGRQNRLEAGHTPSEVSDSDASHSIPASSAHPSGSAGGGGAPGVAGNNAVGSPQRGGNTAEAGGGNADKADDLYAEAIMREVREYRDENEALREGMDELRQSFNQSINDLIYKQNEAEERCARLEELLNEIMELHQNDIETIKSQVSEQEEIALYQNKDSLRMFRESLNMLDQKVHNLESLQAQQQQYPQLGEGWAPGGDYRALMMKILTMVITFIQILLFMAGLLIDSFGFFVRTPKRLILTSILGLLLAAGYHKQEEIQALINKLKQRTNLGENS